MTCTRYPLTSLNSLLDFMKNEKSRETQRFNSEIQNHFLIETQLVWAWSENFKNFIQNVNQQYENNLDILMNKFTEGTTLRARVTPPVIVTEQDHVNSRNFYTEYLTKKKKRLKSIKDYKNELSFQNLFSHLKFYTKEPGKKHQIY